MPIISVVLPVYNAEKYVDAAILSILQQTLINFEFIIINDGSTDSSLAIIKKYQCSDNRIILINRENKGLVASLNEGIAIAKGKYIARMDADDISLPTRFSEQLDFLECHPHIGVCGTWMKTFNNTNTRQKTIRPPIMDAQMKANLLFSGAIMHPTVFLRKSMLDKYNLHYQQEYKNAEDYKLWLDCSKYIQFANIPKVLLRYRLTPNSITQQLALDYQQHFKVIHLIFSEVLAALGVKNTAIHDQLHFALAPCASQALKVSVNLKEANRYLRKILLANKKAKKFAQAQLTKTVADAFFYIVVAKIRKRKMDFLLAVFYLLFWQKIYFSIIKAP